MSKPKPKPQRRLHPTAGFTQHGKFSEEALREALRESRAAQSRQLLALRGLLGYFDELKETGTINKGQGWGQRDAEFILECRVLCANVQENVNIFEFFQIDPVRVARILKEMREQGL